MPAVASLAVLVLSAQGGAEASEICRLLEDDAPKSIASSLAYPPYSCDSARTSGGTQTFFCAWDFEYRSEASEAFFERVSTDIARCAAITSGAKTAAPVNHPDTHRVHQYELGRKVVSVSLKDKAGQKRTLVFVTVRHDS